MKHINDSLDVRRCVSRNCDIGVRRVDERNRKPAKYTGCPKNGQQPKFERNLIATKLTGQGSHDEVRKRE